MTVNVLTQPYRWPSVRAADDDNYLTTPAQPFDLRRAVDQHGVGQVDLTAFYAHTRAVVARSGP